MFLPVCTVFVCMSFCVFCVFFFYGPFGVPELKCTYFFTYPCKLCVATFSFIIAEAAFTIFGILYLMHLFAKAC